jgi:hypothetical protein
MHGVTYLLQLQVTNSLAYIVALLLEPQNLSYEMASRIVTWKHDFIINSLLFPYFYFRLIFMNM